MLFDTTYKAVTTIVNNIEKYKSNSIDDALPYLADLNIEQRAKGLNADGQLITPALRSEAYANAKKSTIKKELKKYTGRFTPTIVERKGSFVDRVKELQDTNSAELEFRQINFSNNPLQPIQAHLKTVKYKMSFSSTTSTLDKVRSLSSIIQSNDFKKATVEGIDENGNDVVYRLFNDFDRFQEYDYEDMVPSLNLDPDGLTDSILQNTIVSELKSVFLTIRPALES